MPPSTRREVRLSASLPDNMAHVGGTQPSDQSRSANLFMPNIESILENFELFKRKHISQNREIIKANAVHQLRIRELENRIQTLEAEKAEARLHTVGLEATVSHLHHAMASIYAGWHLIGKGFANSTSDPASIPSFHFDAQPLSWPPSNRIKLEPNPNTAAVVKQVATAPGGHVGRLEEELLQGPTEDAVTAESNSNHKAWQHSVGALQSARHPTVDASIIDIGGAPSPMGSPQLPDELEDAIAAAAERTMSQAWSNRGGAATPVPKPLSLNMFFSAPQDSESIDNSNRQALRRSGRKSSRRQSGFIASQPEHDPQGNASDFPHHERESSPPPTSDPHDDQYLPSEANSEAMDGILAYNGQEATLINRPSAFQHPPTPFLDITNHTAGTSYLDAASAQHTGREPVPAQEPSSKPSTTDTPYAWPREEPAAASSSSEARTPGGRKRKVPTHELPEPLPTPMRLFGTAASSDATPMATAPVDSESDPATGRTRRVRKSINYALPKLNTKMRKPDPSDLIPATTPHRSNRSTPSSARGMIGSSGNLSDIRKLHEEAALHQSPAERTSNLRLTGSPRASTSRAKLLAAQPLTAQEDAGGRMADLFEIRQQAKMLADQSNASHPASGRPHAFWDNVTDTSDDESRATSNADLGELAELEAAMGELSTVDEAHQADTPRAPQSSAWPSRSTVQMSASSSTDSMVSGSSGGNLAQRPSLRRKTTTLPSRSRQSSVEQALPSDNVLATRPGPESATTNASANTARAKVEGDEKSASPKELDLDRKEQAQGIAKNSNPGEVKRATRQPPAVTSSDTSSVELGKGRPPPAAAAGSLVAGMKPKQRPASAGALLSSRSVSASASVDSSSERPRTFSGATAANAGMAQSQSSAGPSGCTPRSAVSTAQHRASLHSALTSQSKTGASQVTPRIGAKGLPPTSTPTFRESPRMTSTPMLRPTPSASSLASESSGRSSPALSVTSSTSAGTQLSSSTRTSMKTSTTATSSGNAARRPGTAGSLSRDDTTPKVGTQSTTMPGARPQPARSMPSLRRGSDKAGVTSTPRITVRSTSSTAASSGVGANGTLAASSAATIAASRVARAMSSGMPVRTKEAAAAPMGLGIDFSSVVDEVSAGKELLSLTGEIEQVVQLASSPLRASSSPSSRSSAAPSSSPRSTYKASHDDGPTLGGSQAKTRRTSRRISSMTA
ncbi:hypothetical protein PaG_05854 [Moesziomyces aphidis]|uniref:Shugoshin C-terminal domain-containing protein n=1 Tax=Moesziomyces aphidis TaxID=84754 RepID=W3VFH8_MOEAP|nr:hypothetical protein PaG_05854 [Moesziomyces aphidis]